MPDRIIGGIQVDQGHDDPVDLYESVLGIVGQPVYLLSGGTTASEAGLVIGQWWAYHCVYSAQEKPSKDLVRGGQE